MDTPLPLVVYLFESSRTSLKMFRLKKLGLADARKKEVRIALREWVEAEAHGLLALWLDEYGEELVELAAGRPPAKTTADLDGIAAPVLRRQHPPDRHLHFQSDWLSRQRSRERRFRKAEPGG